jgi:DNA-binding LytR/AlgR family response regulator
MQVNPDEVLSIQGKYLMMKNSKNIVVETQHIPSWQRYLSMRKTKTEFMGMIQLNRRMFPIADIVYFRACDQMIDVYMKNRATKTIYHTIKQLHIDIPSFILIHEGTLVNPVEIIRGVSAAGQGRHALLMSNDTSLPIAKGRTPSVRKQLTEINSNV